MSSLTGYSEKQALNGMPGRVRWQNSCSVFICKLPDKLMSQEILLWVKWGHHGDKQRGGIPPCPCIWGRRQPGHWVGPDRDVSWQMASTGFKQALDLSKHLLSDQFIVTTASISAEMSISLIQVSQPGMKHHIFPTWIIEGKNILKRKQLSKNQ